MPTNTAKTIAAIVASLGAFCPNVIREQTGVAFAFVFIDTILGLVVARYMHTIASKILREKLVSKLASYSILVAVGSGAGVLSHTWVFVSAALLAVIAIEVVSMLENLALWSKRGNLKLGPAQPFIDMISRYFAVMEVPPTPPQEVPAPSKEEDPDAKISLPPSAPDSK